VRALALAALAAALVGGCAAPYVGAARSFDPSGLREPGWLRARGVPEVRQASLDDCGLAVASMVLGHWGRPRSLEALRATAPVPAGGLAARQVRDLLRQAGLRAFVIAGTMEDLAHELQAGRPLIVGTVKPHDRKKVRAHYEVVVAYHPARQEVVTLDPAEGWRVSPLDGFVREWAAAEHTTIVALPGG
jgi:ATP-binding cassette, subfamily B, bacterial